MPWSEFTVTDRNLIIGQNPGSAAAVARAQAAPAAAAGLWLVLAAGLAANALMLAAVATYNHAAAENVGLAAWLAGHDLRSG